MLFRSDPISEDLQNVKMVPSSYTEDVYNNNHTTVWGSYYHENFGWGYKCCGSNDKNSWCKGERGKAENLKRIEEVDKAKFEKIRIEKEAQKFKEEQLNKKNKTEESNGAFTEIFERMNHYENTGTINSQITMLNKKTERPTSVSK